MLFESEVNTSNSDLPATFGSSDALGQQLQTQQSNQTRTFADILIEERNAELAVRWEREAKKITCSVFELNNIFKDLAHMVVQQVSSNSITVLYLASNNSIVFNNCISCFYRVVY